MKVLEVPTLTSSGDSLPINSNLTFEMIPVAQLSTKNETPSESMENDVSSSMFLASMSVVKAIISADGGGGTYRDRAFELRRRQ